ncbi:CAP domain-containing protein [uncultured Brachyspira sp.]|uniref:CAP domain-containing protein n=1 Tax=uncultured Brachyspira sp. TaxID=221953 RepID=UPI002610BE5D|nr:CAP domain-containing protein [uncultured Brachyspira sp.]
MKNIILFLFCILVYSLPLFSQDPEEAAKLLELINAERKKAGLYEYKTSDELKNVAAIRAEEIAEVFESSRPDGREIYTVYTDNNIRVAYYGESIRSGHQTADGIFRAMMKDQNDSSSILDIDYTYIGVGIYKNAKNTYWAILYCSLAD